MSKRIGDSWTDWTEPVNLGKYINTLTDDKYLTIPSSGIKAYTVRDGMIDGQGGLDLYEFILPPSMRPEIVVNVFGYVSDENKAPVGSLIRFYDDATGLEQGSAVSAFSDGYYRISLPPMKKYNVVIDMKGYLYLTDVLDLTDMSKYMKKEYMNDILVNELPEIKALQAKMTELNAQLLELINQNSENVTKSIKDYEELIKQYRSSINSLDLAIKKAKLEWMGKEDKIQDIRKDFQLQTIRVGATFELKNIFFDFGKASLRDESKVELNKLVDIMKRSEIVIELGGHTDSIGSDEANLRLSQDRVNSVKQYLVDNGINGDRIQAVGYGETQPLESNTTEEGRQKNRRVEVKILQLQLGREGQDVVTEQPKEKKQEESNFDFLSTLMKAAKKGGLPGGSPCSDKPIYLTEYKKAPTPTTTTKKALTKNKLFDFDEVEKDNFVFKTFNPYVRNSNFAKQTITSSFPNYTVFEGGSLGAGVNFVSDKLRETTFEYFFMNDDSIKWTGYFNYNYNWQFFKSLNFPLLTIFGFNTHFWQYNSTVIGDKGHIILNVPIGLRFNYELADGIIIAPLFKYNFGTNLKDFSNDLTATYWTAGIDARFKFIQGGVSLNSGDFIKYLGFRVGFAL